MLASLLLTLGPLGGRVVTGLPVTHLLGDAVLVACGLTLAWWRTRPLLTVTLGPLLGLVTGTLGIDNELAAVILLAVFATLVAERYEGRAAWLAASVFAIYLAVAFAAAGSGRIGVLVLALPPYGVGVALRLRRQAAERLAAQVHEIETEEARFTELAVRNERARIASELHDIVSHALTVVVIQAAAGQRLADRSPSEAAYTLATIAEIAREGRSDLHRLVDLLGEGGPHTADASSVEELVRRASLAGVPVTGGALSDWAWVPPRAQHIAYRVVQEGLTNAVRHAAGAPIRVSARYGPTRSLTIRVDNDAPSANRALPVMGSGQGLAGLRERVVGEGGRFDAGPLPDGGWRLEARLPGPPTSSDGPDSALSTASSGTSRVQDLS